MSDKSLKFELGQDGYTNDICRWAALNQVHTISIDNFEKDFEEMERALRVQFRGESCSANLADGKLDKKNFKTDIRVRPLVLSCTHPGGIYKAEGIYKGIKPDKRISNWTSHYIKFAILKD